MLKLRQQIVQPVDKAHRVLKLFAQAQHRLIKKDRGPVRKSLLIPLIFHLENDWMVRIDLQNRLRSWNLLSAGFQQALEAGIKIMLINDKAGSTRDQTGRRAYFLVLFPQNFPHLTTKPFELITALTL